MQGSIFILKLLTIVGISFAMGILHPTGDTVQGLIEGFWVGLFIATAMSVEQIIYAAGKSTD